MAADDPNDNEPISAEGFVNLWLSKWGVEYPAVRAVQLVNDLRRLSGDAIEFPIEGD